MTPSSVGAGDDGPMGMRVAFWGAAGTVTGSRFVVDTGTARVLVDCGLFQGLKRLREANWEPFPVDPASIDAVVLTHAHIDHSGYLPALVRDGFRGRIWCTPGTAALARIMLLDSAHLQEEDARFANRQRSSKHHPALPLYTQADAGMAIERLRAHPPAGAFRPAEGIEARFSPAGHILGAASVWICDGSRSVLFSGDLGRFDDPIMAPPAPPLDADHVVVESTYGNRRHPDEDPAAALAQVVTDTARRGGIVLIPVFAVGRAQTVLHLLAGLRRDGRIPSVPTFLNSPMAVHATELFLASPDEHRLDEREVAALRDGVELVRSVEDSMALTSRRGPMVVLSASGMLTGGRVLHHLRQVAPDRRNTIVLAGFQAAGTRGEALQHGAATLRVFGEDVPVRARVVQLDSLSAHADADGVMAWLASAPSPPSAVSVVHGEATAAETLRRRIRHELGWTAAVPSQGDSVAVASSSRVLPVEAGEHLDEPVGVVGEHAGDSPGREAPHGRGVVGDEVDLDTE
jgi:metallo-beta-lactamase family protein